MTMRKLAARAAAAITMLAIASPALPCGDAKQTSADNQPAPAATPATPKDAVAKKTAVENGKTQGKKSSAKKATAAN